MVAGTARVNDSRAHEIMQRAHEAGYRYPAGFAGFRTSLEASIAGDQVSGTIAVRAPKDIEIDAATDEAGMAWLRQELASVAGHRWHAPYSEADGRHTLTLDADDGHPLGQLVEVQDDRFASSYRVRDGQIAQVNRQMGTLRFSILIQDRVTAPDGRTLPAHFTVVFWDLEHDRLTRTDIHRDQFETVSGIPLLASRRVITVDDAGVTVKHLRLSNHEIFDGIQKADEKGS